MNATSQRYSRQTRLPEVGIEGQEKLGKSKVLIVGMGGLGCPAALYLSAAGVGTLGLVDHDRVDESNLHRQVLYGESEVGQLKVEAAQQALQKLNTETTIHTYAAGFTVENALELVNAYDLIIDGTDNFQSKYLINDACVLADKPWVYASIFKYEGQISVFNFRNGPSYRCLFPVVPKADISCEETGVIGVLPGVLGVYQATEALKILLNLGDVLSGKLKMIDTLTMQDQLIKFQRNEDQIKVVKSRPLRLEAIHYELADTAKLYLDVREPNEQPQLDAREVLKIPLSELPNRFGEIQKEETIHVFCQSGRRSEEAVEFLNKERGLTNVVNVKGGIQSILK